MLKKKIAISALTALMGLSLVVAPAFANRGDHGRGHEEKGDRNQGLHLGFGLGVGNKDRGNHDDGEGVEIPVAPSGKHLDIACAKTSITTRDTAVMSAQDVHAASVKAALAARHDAMLKALDLTDETARKAALKNARQAFEKSEGDAGKALQDARKAAGQKFKTDLQACVVANS